MQLNPFLLYKNEIKRSNIIDSFEDFTIGQQIWISNKARKTKMTFVRQQVKIWINL